MPSNEPKPKFKKDDPVWIHWSSGTKLGWIVGVIKKEKFHKDGYFFMYEILQEDGSGPEYGGVAERLLELRE